MAIYYRLGESIECSGASLKFKKLEPKLPAKNYPQVGTLNRYKLSRSASVDIVEELGTKEPIIDENSALNKGDRVDGNSILVKTQSFIKKTNHSIKKGSGRHGAQNTLVSKSFVYAKIEKQHSTIPD